jgi:endogenous inhibitor of DNA gyrase (YacG/DUF329 family)
MAEVRCPDCGTVIPLPPGTKSGDLIECPKCAGNALWVKQEGNEWVATIAHRVSCPDCDKVVTLPENTRAGDLIDCCGRSYRLTFEWGAFAAEPFADP